jgi:hypothetical protein
MQRVVEILLSAFLRRYPLPTRVSLFGFLSRYAWLKDILEELRPELFPAQPEPEASQPVSPASRIAPQVLGLLERSEIRGQRGYYKAETYLSARGRGHLFSATETTSRQPVVIKEFLLPETQFSKAEALQRQSNFQRLAGLQLADGRLQDFRVIQPIEAIADTESHDRCYLVTPALDSAPTLGQHLSETGTLPLEQVREVLSQILQSLDFLHRQKFNFPSGALQDGLVHGNLSLNSLLWIEQAQQPFVYLTDLRLWEQYFDPTIQQLQSTQATRETIQTDLKATGTIGFTLLRGLDWQPPNLPESAGIATVDVAPDAAPIDPSLRFILDALQRGQYDSAEAARRDLMQLAARSPAALTSLPSPLPAVEPAKQWSPLLLLGLLGLLAGAFVLLSRWRSPEAPLLATPPVTTCCLGEVSGIPTGSYRYTSVKNGIWWQVMQQQSLVQRNQGLGDQLAASQPSLNLGYSPAATMEDILAQVRSGAADFAVVPLTSPLPNDLLAEEIAYDGLAIVVPFSYAKRQQGLPTALNGQLSLSQVQQLYTGQVNQWSDLGGPKLSVQRYVSSNPDVTQTVEQKVLNGQPLSTLPGVELLPTIELLRQVIRDFEENTRGSIGITTISEMWGQCSVYPLAISTANRIAVQPLVLSNGQSITPETDLCDRKGAYAPDSELFRTGTYPLSFPIVVLYPRDNRRSAMGKKFVELMRTGEGQQLLKAAGLVPLTAGLGVRSASRPSVR